jgi:hypothetical protein
VFSGELRVRMSVPTWPAPNRAGWIPEAGCSGKMGALQRAMQFIMQWH